MNMLSRLFSAILQVSPQYRRLLPPLSEYFSAAHMKLSPSDLYCVTTINRMIPRSKVKVITPNPEKQSRSPEDD